MSNYTLYKHTFPNNKLYFGITCRPLIERWRKDGSGYRKNPSMWRAIKKYGWDNVKHDILFENLSEEAANKLEQEYINKFNTTDRRFGYNIMPGGLVASGWHHSEESKKKMSIAQQGHKMPDKYEPWNKGKSYGKKVIYQYSLNGELLNIFNNTQDAANSLGIPKEGIFECARLKCKSYYGFIFTYEQYKPEELLYKYKNQQGAHKITVYQYDKTGNLVNIYISYRAVMEAVGISESNLEECLQNRRKTTDGFVFSKIELTKEEVLEHYKRKTRKTKYKFLLINKETGAKTLYNTLDDMAKTLQVKPAVLRNIINGANSKLNKMYKFERILNNEN